MVIRRPAFLRGVVGFAALLVLLVAGGPRPSSAAQAEPEQPELARSNRIHWRGGDYFLSGVNYPFYRYYGGDVATLATVDDDCIWRTESSFDYMAIDRDFATMKAGGVNTVRWFLFGDGRGAPEFDAAGRITGLDATFFAHMDQVLEIARRHNIYIMWSLWDFLAFERANWLCGGNLQRVAERARQLPDGARQQYENHLRLAANMEAFDRDGKLKDMPSAADAADAGRICFPYAGGHRNLVLDTAPGGVQDSFFQRALIPMLQRYAGNQHIVGWEIMNEPEWVVDDVRRMGQNPTVHEPVPLAPLRSFFRRFTDAVHAHAPQQLATVGSASLKWMGGEPYLPDNTNLWQGLGFDYYGVHYYGWMETQFNRYSPLQRDYFADPDMQRIDAPVVVGEFPIHGGSPPIYLPNIRRLGAESSTLSLRYICTAFLQGGDPPCTRPYSATIEYYGPDGGLAITQQVTLPPNGSWTGTAPVQPGDWAGSARIVANGPIAAQVTQANIPNAAETVAYTGQDRGAETLYLPHIVNLAGNHRSRIALQNTSVQTATVTIKYYSRDGALAATDANITLRPRGMTLLDPTFAPLKAPERVDGPPLGFQGSAVVQSNRALVGVVYELSPAAGSDAYAAAPEGWNTTLNLPSVRNWGNNGDPRILLQNTRGGSATATITYYNAAGVAQPAVPGDTINLPAYGSAEIQPAARLPGGFVGAATISSDQYMAVVVRSTSTNATTGAKTLVLYSGHPESADRYHFPVLSSGGAAGGGMYSTITAQNIDAGRAITLVATFNRADGTSRVFTNTVAPRGSWVLGVRDAMGPDFVGSAEVLWPWPSATGWSGAFPLIAVARQLDDPHTTGVALMGQVSHSFSWAVTPYTPRQMLEGILAKNWAGALGWSYYDGGTGQWDDYVAASRAFAQAHPAILDIGGSSWTPGEPPKSTPTPAYGNSATATAVAGAPTAQPTCGPGAIATPTATCSFNFSDVQPEQYFYEPLRYLYCAGVISGYSDGTFRPFANATRGQVAKIVTLAQGWAINTTGGPHFSDVPAANAFYTFIETAYNRGVIAGYGDGTFRWGNDITRGQLSKVIVLARGWTANTTGGPHFNDVPATNAFYEFVETAYNRGIISGYADGTFRPFANATRGQIGKIVYESLGR